RRAMAAHAGLRGRLCRPDARGRAAPGSVSVDRIRIEPIAAFRDNYIWMFHDGKRAVVVDPGMAEPVLEALDKQQLELCAIVLTHLHYDHNLGVPGLLGRRWVPVFGPSLNEHDRHSHPPFP